MTGAPLKVLYIGGTGRTGSTLLDRLLGQVPGVFAGGELAFFWRMALREGGRCTCGAAVRECPVWRPAVARAFPDGIDADEMIALRRRANSVHLPLMVSRAAQARLLRRLGPFPARVAALYRAVADLTDSRLLVDSSKEPHYSWILRSREELDVRFVHLVRDPRAIAHSWRRRRVELGLGDRMMEQRGPAKSAVYQDVSNVASELLWSRRRGRYLRLRYEDLLDDPAAAFERLETFVGETLDTTSFLTGHHADVAPTHSVWGNPNRFATGPVALTPDDEWEHAMPRRDRWIASTMTWPVTARYGYPLRAPITRRAPAAVGSCR